jgi:hypothetical protein
MFQLGLSPARGGPSLALRCFQSCITTSARRGGLAAAFERAWCAIQRTSRATTALVQLTLRRP